VGRKTNTNLIWIFLSPHLSNLKYWISQKANACTACTFKNEVTQLFKLSYDEEIAANSPSGLELERAKKIVKYINMVDINHAYTKNQRNVQME
jgi:hypothetical protein